MRTPHVPTGAALRPWRARLAALAATLAVALALTACGQPQTTAPRGTGAQPGGQVPAGPAAVRLSGSFVIDGSSTVFSITEGMAEEFRKVQPDVRVTVGLSGTGGGFQKFCAGETVISNASRPIRTAEAQACTVRGIEWIELPVAYDALSVVVNPQNTWANCITVPELKKLWEPAAQGSITSWNQIRPDWPGQPIRLYGPGTDSGTFDYFTEVIVGTARSSRGDYVASEDDNVLVQGVIGDRGALGYFGLAYYVENQSRLKAVQIDGGNGCVAPSVAAAENGSYAPLSRPLFIYVRKDAAKQPEVKAFVDFYLNSAPTIATQVGYVKLPQRVYDLASTRFSALKTGTAYSGTTAGLSLEQIYSRG